MTYQYFGWQDLTFNLFSTTTMPSTFLSFAFLAFFCGFVGLSWRASNVLLVVVFNELMLVSLVFGFYVLSRFYGNFGGTVYPLFILNAAAAETATALAIILTLFQTTKSVSFFDIKNLRG